VKLAFLGTGGSYPSRERMTQAMAVRYKGDVILFDCGEGTQRQMMLSSLSFMSIKTICITHFHGDHFLGLAGLVQTMQLNQRKDLLEILVPVGGKKFTDDFLHLGHFAPRFEVAVTEMADGARRDFEEYSITAGTLAHTVPTIGFRLEEHERPGRFDKEKALALGVPEGPAFSKLQRGEPVEAGGRTVRPGEVVGPRRAGHALAYITDTGPCVRAVELARGADILVMEATADDALTDYANQYGHCAATQTARTAKDAGVGELFIVHTSSRYKESEPILGQAKATFPATRLPDDLTEVEYAWG
jgi:ribonuclease Z